MNTSLTNPLAPAVAGTQVASDQLAAQRAKRELRKMQGTEASSDVRAIEDPVAIEAIHDQKPDDQPQQQKKKKKPTEEENKLDVTG